MTKNILIAGLFGVLGVVATVAILARVATNSSSFESTWLNTTTFEIPSVAFLATLFLLGKASGNWPIPTRTLRLFATIMNGTLCGLAAYLSFTAVSLIWNGPSLPQEKQSFVYLVLHPHEIPRLREQRESRQPHEGTIETDLSYWPPVIMASLLGGFVVFVWAGRWDEI